jgi:hypothetical protein
MHKLENKYECQQECYNTPVSLIHLTVNVFSGLDVEDIFNDPLVVEMLEKKMTRKFNKCQKTVLITIKYCKRQLKKVSKYISPILITFQTNNLATFESGTGSSPKGPA